MAISKAFIIVRLLLLRHAASLLLHACSVAILLTIIRRAPSLAL